MCLIEFENFFFRYKGNKEYALNNINLKLDQDKFILLAGETGSGKTSLIRCLNGLIPQFYSGYYKGEVKVGGKDTAITPIADLSTEVGIVFQNPENQLVAMNVEHEIAFGMENLGFQREIIDEKLKNVMELTEITDIAHKAPFEISGGEQQRVAIASILVLDPKIIVLDEPTANLDPLFAQKIITLLKKIQKEKELTVIISEHRMDLIIPIVEEIILMKQGRIIAHDKKDVILNGEEFTSLNLNQPRVFSIFNKLKKRGLIEGNLPVSIDEAIKLLNTLK